MSDNWESVQMDVDGKSVLFGVYIRSLFRLVSFLHFL